MTEVTPITRRIRKLAANCMRLYCFFNELTPWRMASKDTAKRLHRDLIGQRKGSV
ncbi:hypothetical protein I79_017908 [Cricetulus griseus]|uniref:Uncharacterized protein n=1 Tax=Cricetulus griseus TaxID=10029 RepID=G3I3A6_CRIGR|nr:hypothetical protein I79_017908 [Cricetulus griseus]